MDVGRFAECCRRQDEDRNGARSLERSRLSGTRAMATRRSTWRPLSYQNPCRPILSSPCHCAGHLSPNSSSGSTNVNSTDRDDSTRQWTGRGPTHKMRQPLSTLFLFFFSFLSLPLSLSLTTPDSDSQAPQDYIHAETDYQEQLHLRPLPRAALLASFSFRSNTTFSEFTSRNFRLFPRSLGQILSYANTRELHLRFNLGRWDAESWGSRPWNGAREGGTGVELWAWLVADSEAEAERKWVVLTNALSGLFCASLNFIDSTRTTRPVMSFRPEGNHNDVDPGKMHLLHGVLPHEVVCTENLTPFLKLLPCKGKAGIASLLDGHKLFDASWQSMAIDVRPICVGEDECVLQIEQTIDMVLDVDRAKRPRGKVFLPSLSRLVQLTYHCRESHSPSSPISLPPLRHKQTIPLSRHLLSPRSHSQPGLVPHPGLRPSPERRLSFIQSLHSAHLSPRSLFSQGIFCWRSGRTRKREGKHSVLPSFSRRRVQPRPASSRVTRRRRVGFGRAPDSATSLRRKKLHRLRPRTRWRAGTAAQPFEGRTCLVHLLRDTSLVYADLSTYVDGEAYSK